MTMRSKLITPLRFLIVGASNTVLTLVVFVALVAAGCPAGPASAIGFLAGALNGFFLNRSWTFRGAVRAGTAATMGRYFAVQLLGAALSAAGVWLMTARFREGHLVAEAAVLPLVTVVTYSLCRRFVFAPPPTATESPRSGAGLPAQSRS